jgi:ceramide glucosyltransferase
MAVTRASRHSDIAVTMTIAIWAAGAFSIVATACQVGSILIAIERCRMRRATPGQAQTALGLLGLTRFLRRKGINLSRRRGRRRSSNNAPGVSIVRPVCGIENHGEETLRSAFLLDYPSYEIIFCAAAAGDPVVPLVQRLIAEHPEVPARLLVGNESISDNPKLNNVCKGWRAAAHDWLVMADSNVLMPRDYIQRLLAAWRDDTGLVASPPVGCRPDGFWAELECAFLNTHQARWQYVADSMGLGFAQGKSMLYRKSEVEKIGGIRLLAAEPAEDAATTKIVRAAGHRVRLVDGPFEQPLGRRGAREVWARQRRWARLRTASFPQFYLLEALAGGALPLALAAYVVAALGLPWVTMPVPVGIWYGAEAALPYSAGWHLGWRSPFAWMLRDLLLPVLWILGWTGSGVTWRGHHISTVESESAV